MSSNQPDINKQKIKKNIEPVATTTSPLLDRLEQLLERIKKDYKLEETKDEKEAKELEEYIKGANKLKEQISDLRKDTKKLLEKYTKIQSESPALEDPDFAKAEAQSRSDVLELATKMKELSGKEAEFIKQVKTKLNPPAKPERKRAAEAAKTRSAKAAARTPEWATQDVVEKVKLKLEELGRSDAVHELEEAFENYQRTESGSADRIKCEAILKAIVNMPGWGHNELSERDKRVYITRETFEKRKLEVLFKLKEKNLAGTDAIIMPILTSYFNLWDIMVERPPATKAGEEIPVNTKLVLPVFCIDGPPGVGKTTIVNALADVLDLPSQYARTQGSSPGDISGYTRQYGTPKPSLITSARTTTKNKSSAVILLDELDKASRATQDAVGGVTEKSETIVKDEYLQIDVDKGFNLIIATTNNYSLLPEHLQSRMQKLYFGGYTDAEKEAILKNKAISEIGPRYLEMQFLSKGGGNDPKQYKEERGAGKNKVTTKKDSQCFVAPTASDDDIDAIRYIVENYITEAGVREADGLLGRVIAAASTEYNSRLYAKLAELRKVKADASLSDAAKEVPPVKINKAIIHRAIGDPDKYIIIIKNLNKQIHEANAQFAEASEKLAVLIEKMEERRIEGDNKALEEALIAFQLAKSKLVEFENQLIKALEKRSEISTLDRSVKENIRLQITQHRDMVSNINSNSEKLVASANILLGIGRVDKKLVSEATALASKDKPTTADKAEALKLIDKLLEEAGKAKPEDMEQFSALIQKLITAFSKNTLDSTVKLDQLTLKTLQTRLDSLKLKKELEKSSEPSKPKERKTASDTPVEQPKTQKPSRILDDEESVERKIAREHGKGKDPNKRDRGSPKLRIGGEERSSHPRIRTGKTGGLFFQHDVAKEIEGHPKFVIKSYKPITEKVFKEVANELEKDLRNLSTKGSKTPEYESAFKGLEVIKPKGGITDTITIARGDEDILTVKHTSNNSVEIESASSTPEDDAIYAMVLAAKTAASIVGSKRMTIENCGTDYDTVLRMALIAISMGLTPVVKDKETLKGILEGDYAKQTLIPGGKDTPKTIADIYEEAIGGQMKHEELINYIAQLQYVERNDKLSPN